MKAPEVGISSPAAMQTEQERVMWPAIEFLGREPSQNTYIVAAGPELTAAKHEAEAVRRDAPLHPPWREVLVPVIQCATLRPGELARWYLMKAEDGRAPNSGEWRIYVAGAAGTLETHLPSDTAGHDKKFTPNQFYPNGILHWEP